MLPGIEEAWIAGGSALVAAIVGIGGTVAVALRGFASTRKATSEQIDAARRNRMWDKQAEAHVDTVAYIQFHQLDREKWSTGNTRESDPDADAADVSQSPSRVPFSDLQARLVAYASPAVLHAFSRSNLADWEFTNTYDAWSTWAHPEQPVPKRSNRLGDYEWLVPIGKAELKRDVERAREAANAAGTALIALIRSELQARPSQVGAVPLSIDDSHQPPLEDD